MNDEQKSGAVLAAVCSLGRSLGFRVAGQGVETIEHAQLLRAAGCTEAQGYYYAPPMPLEQLLKMEQESQSSRSSPLQRKRRNVSTRTIACCRTPHAPDDEQRRESIAVNSSPDEGALPTS